MAAAWRTRMIFKMEARYALLNSMRNKSPIISMARNVLAAAAGESKSRTSGGIFICTRESAIMAMYVISGTLAKRRFAMARGSIPFLCSDRYSALMEYVPPVHMMLFPASNRQAATFPKGARKLWTKGRQNVPIL